jgi:predicted RNA methylase
VRVASGAGAGGGGAASGASIAGAHDVTSVDIGLTAMSDALAALTELETSLAAGRIDVPAARRLLLAAYAPPPDSPLIGAGRPNERGARGTIGAVAPIGK